MVVFKFLVVQSFCIGKKLWSLEILDGKFCSKVWVSWLDVVG